jgi:hypothetical protein
MPLLLNTYTHSLPLELMVSLNPHFEEHIYSLHSADSFPNELAFLELILPLNFDHGRIAF